MGNSGPTIAEEVRIGLDPPLPEWAPDEEAEDATRLTALLDEGLRSVPPGREFHWTLGVAHTYFPNDGADPVPRVQVSIDSLGRGHSMPTLTYSIDLEDIKRQSARPIGIAIIEQPMKAKASHWLLWQRRSRGSGKTDLSHSGPWDTPGAEGPPTEAGTHSRRERPIASQFPSIATGTVRCMTRLVESAPSETAPPEADP